jgi:WD40 repeat protein
MGNACCGNDSGAQVKPNTQKPDAAKPATSTDNKTPAAAPAATAAPVAAAAKPADAKPAEAKAAPAVSSSDLELTVQNFGSEDKDKKEEPGSDIDSHVNHAAGNAAKAAEGMVQDDDGIFGVAKVEKKEFTAVRPWKGQVFAPSAYASATISSAAPAVKIDLEWAYGYRGYDAHDNIAIDKQGRVVYPIAAVVVAYDPATHTQAHYLGHNDDVTCLAQNPADNNIFATGQVATIEDLRGTKPRICVWNSANVSTLQTMKDVFKRAVNAVAFSPSGKYLAAIGDDVGAGFTCKVWDWASNKLLGVADADKEPNTLFAITWKNENEFVTVGTKHVFFWEFNGGAPKKSRGLVGSAGLQSFLCAEFFGSEHCLVGARDGSIYFFKGKTVVSVLQATQTGPVYSIVSTPTGFVSGDRAGNLTVWDRKLKPAAKLTVEGASAIRALYIKGDRALVGTENCRILDFANITQNAAPKCLVSGHFDGELWGLDVNPKNVNEFATVGEDNQIFIYDLAKHNITTRGFINVKPNNAQKRKHERASTMSALPTEQCARSVVYSPDASVLAVGTNEGEVAIYSTANLARTKLLDLNSTGKQNISASKKNGNWIQSLRFNPSGTVLAAATRGIVTVLIDVTKDYTPVHALDKSSSSVTYLDWSADSKVLRTNDRGYEVLYYNIAPNLKESTHNTASRSLNDTVWATETCPMSWATEFMFDGSMDGTDVNAVDRSPDGKLIANGDDFGLVNVFSYPVRSAKTGRVAKTAHSSHVMNVRFTKDGKYLLSAGGNDKSVMQWKISA